MLPPPVELCGSLTALLTGSERNDPCLPVRWRRRHLSAVGMSPYWAMRYRKDQRFAHRLDVQSDDYLIDHRACLTVADSIGMGNILGSIRDT